MESYLALRAEREIDGLDEASARLLPAAYVNLAEARFDHPDMPRLRRTHLHYRFEAERQLQTIDAVATVAETAAIPIMAGKGAALLLHQLVAPGQRPMRDIDLYITRDRAVELVGRLRERGWVVDHTRFLENPVEEMRLMPSLELRHAEHGELDLHWHQVSECSLNQLDSAFWADATPHQAIPVLLPAPGKLLLQSVVHGLRRNVVSPVRWIVDATLILRTHAAELDWSDLHGLARMAKIGHRWHSGLAYLGRRGTLSANAGLQIPPPSSWIEFVENRIALADTAHLPRRRQLLRHYLAFAARMAASDDRWHVLPLGLRWLLRRMPDRLR
jgi:hypothetical protein